MYYIHQTLLSSLEEGLGTRLQVLTETVFCFQLICQVRLPNIRSPENGDDVFPADAVPLKLLPEHHPQGISRIRTVGTYVS